MSEEHDPFAPPIDSDEGSAGLTMDEIEAAAGDNEVFAELWSEAEDGTLMSTPFVFMVFWCPPAWFAYHGAFLEALGAMAIVVGSTFVLGMAPLVTEVTVPWQLAALGLQGALALWAHPWLYGAVVRRVETARREHGDPEARLEAIRAGSGPFELAAGVGFLVYYATLFGIGIARPMVVAAFAR